MPQPLKAVNVSGNHMRIFQILFLFFIIGCSDKASKPSLDSAQKTDSASISSIIYNNNKSSTDTFSPILSYPLINDTAGFINQLKSLDEFGLCWNPEIDQPKARISYYNKINLNGSNEEHILLEYEYGSGANVCYPYKYQFLFTLQGELVTILHALRFELLNIFPNQDPFLLTALSTSRGNGGHQLFKVSADTLTNIYEGYTDYQVQTYDAGEDAFVYEPNELKISIQDINYDGYNDLKFSGRLVLIQGLSKDSIWYDYEVQGNDTISYSVDRPFKKQPIHFVFLYDPKSGFFKESKDLSKGNPYL